MRKEKPSSEYYQETIFLNESEKEYIMMSDGQEIYCMHTMNDKSKSDMVFIFMQGFANLYFTWNDFWDAIHEKFRLVVIDPRDKTSNKLKKTSECTVKRIVLDIVETVKHLNIDESKLVFYGSSIGASYISHAVAQELIKPKICFFTGPAREPRAPKKLLKFFFLFPRFIMNSVGKLVARLYLRNKVSEGFQQYVFYNRIRGVDPSRWKQCRKMYDWNATEDFKKLKVPVYIVRTPEDKYHISYEAEIVQDLIEGSVIIDVPSYDYCHTKPGVNDLVQTLDKIILEEK